jgi:hypothetical protein
MPFIPRKIMIATAIAGVGALGVGVAGAVGGISVTPGPSDHADSHPAPQATSVTVPDAASAGSGNAATPPAAPNTDVATDAAPDVSAQGAPSAGEAPSASDLSTALDATSGTPGNTVLNDLINTAPGPERGSTISGDAHDVAPSPPVPDTAPIPDAAQRHMP